MIGGKEREEPDPETVDYIVHQYGLTRDEAREVVKEHGRDRTKIDAAAGRMRALRR
jgi:hypothetical protein